MLTTFTISALLLDLLKYWTPASVVVFGIYRLIRWFKDIRGKDLAELKTTVSGLQDGLTELKTGLTEVKESAHSGLAEVKESITNQTHLIVNELKEQRNDFRTFYGPLLAAMQPKPVPARARAKKK